MHGKYNTIVTTGCNEFCISVGKPSKRTCQGLFITLSRFLHLEIFEINCMNSMSTIFLFQYIVLKKTKYGICNDWLDGQDNVCKINKVQ